MKRAALVILAALLFHLVTMGPSLSAVGGPALPVVLVLMLTVALAALVLILRMVVTGWREVMTRPACIRI
jgi:hypothetical protein